MRVPSRRLRRRVIGAFASGILAVIIPAGPAAAAKPRVTACLGTDTSAGAHLGINGERRSWLAKSSEDVFGAGVNFGAVVQAHQAGMLGGSCGS